MAYSEKREHTKLLIQNAFLDMYREKDISQITVKEICRVTGINRSTFYTYFQDVFDLLDQLENEILGKTLNSFMEMIQSLDSFDFDIIVQKMIRTIYDMDELPILLMKKNKKRYVNLVIDFLKSSSTLDFEHLSPEERRYLSIAMEYHVAGTFDIIDNHMGNEKGDWEPDELLETIARLGSEGPVTMVRKHVSSENQQRISSR